MSSGFCLPDDNLFDPYPLFCWNIFIKRSNFLYNLSCGIILPISNVDIPLPSRKLRKFWSSRLYPLSSRVRVSELSNFIATGVQRRIF